MNSLSDILNYCLSSDSVEVMLRRVSGTNKIKVTTTRHLSSEDSENELARHNKHCRIINIYREGQKAGMQMITNTVVPYCNLQQSGDIPENPLVGHSVASKPLNDST